MPYLISNPPVRKSEYPLTSFGNSQGAGGGTWTYKSADVLATVQAAGYFTDGKARGMQVGDIVEVHETATVPYKISMAVVTALTAAGAASLGTTTVATMQ